MSQVSTHLAQLPDVPDNESASGLYEFGDLGSDDRLAQRQQSDRLEGEVADTASGFEVDRDSSGEVTVLAREDGAVSRVLLTTKRMTASAQGRVERAQSANLMAAKNGIVSRTGCLPIES